MRILIVDDSIAEAQIVGMAIREVFNFSYVLDICEGGLEAIHYLLQKERYINQPPPNIILLDLNMPRPNGIEVLKFVKSTPALQCIPIIILSGSCFMKGDIECYKLGANSFISKSSNYLDYVEHFRIIVNYWANIVSIP